MSWDRYAYVSNNPVNRVDPSGHADKAPDDGGVSKFCINDPECRIRSRASNAKPPKPAQLKSSTWGITVVKGGMTVGQGGSPINYYSDYEGEVANSGNSEFYVNNWSPQVDCRFAASGAARAACLVPPLTDTVMRFIGPKSQQMRQNVNWEMTMGYHDGVVDPISIYLWTSHSNVQLTGLRFDSGSVSDFVRHREVIDPRFGGGVKISHLPKGFVAHNPLTISVTVVCSFCYNTGSGPFSMPSTGSTVFKLIGP